MSAPVAEAANSLKRPAEEEEEIELADGSPKTPSHVTIARGDENPSAAKKVRLEDVPSPSPGMERAVSVSTTAGSTADSRTKNGDEEGSSEDDGSSSSEAQEQPEESATGEDPDQLRARLDSEELDLDNEEESDDEDSLRRTIMAMIARGMPLESLRALGIHIEVDDGIPVDYPFDEPPTSLDDVVSFIQSDKCKKILCLAGAGMSVASGIPDFRSSNGLYATLDATALTATEEQMEEIESNPSFCLDHHLFLENPLPCLEVNREFILGVQERKWKATLAHRFVEMLRTKTNGGKGKLVRLYTQNIDGLEDQCEGIGHHRRIAVHGSMDEATCAVCNATMNFDTFCDRVRRQIKDIKGQDPSAPKESTPIACESCGRNTVKPNIVLFRHRLPVVFFDSVPKDVEDIDLLIVLGTSLAVAPANSVVWRVPKSAMRVLINREPVGWHLGLDCNGNDRDFLARGDCENVVLDLMEKLGWMEDLKPLLEQNELPESSAKLLRERLENPAQEDLKPAAKANSPGQAKTEDAE